MKAKLAPVHPGEILDEEFLKPMGLSARRFAEAIRVPANRVTRLINGQVNVTADTALRLSRALRTTPEFWLNLQVQYDLQSVEDADGYEDIVPVGTV
ncbi:HigA family addiction module antitoxin [Hyphomonas sp.]|uniref:HigA family addiction module antitoxin n=1 Tax=Hyphomonas sp. TaxID=87 RepID=UPI00391C5B4B